MENCSEFIHKTVPPVFEFFLRISNFESMLVVAQFVVFHMNFTGEFGY